LRSIPLGHIEGEIRNTAHRPKILLFALDIFNKDIIPLVKNKKNETTNLPYLPIAPPSRVGDDMMHVIGKKPYSINQYFEAYLYPMP
jgi:hypothetical protein